MEFPSLERNLLKGQSCNSPVTEKEERPSLAYSLSLERPGDHPGFCGTLNREMRILMPR